MQGGLCGRGVVCAGEVHGECVWGVRGVVLGFWGTRAGVESASGVYRGT